MDFQDKKNLYKVRETILEMINDRGYLVNLNGRDWTLNIILEQLYQF